MESHNIIFSGNIKKISEKEGTYKRIGGKNSTEFVKVQMQDH